MRTQFVEDGLEIVSDLVTTKEGKRLDAGESIFMERQLEAVEPRLYQVKRRELKARSLIDVSNVDGPGASTIVYYMYDKTGMAKIIANPGDDLPRADVNAKRYTANVHNLASSFGYSTKDLRNAQFSGVPLEMQKVDAVRRSVHEKENEIAFLGDADYGIVGFLYHPNIPDMQVAAAAGGGFSRVWGVDKTPLEVVADIAALVTNIEATTNQIHMGDTLLLPIDKLRYLATTPMSSTYPEYTILKYIKDPDNGFGITKVEALPELTGIGTGTTNKMVLFESDPEIVELRIPMEMQMLPPQARNLEFLVPVECEIAGVVVRYPMACHFAYGF